MCTHPPSLIRARRMDSDRISSILLFWYLWRCVHALMLLRTISNPFNEQGNGSFSKTIAINQSAIGFFHIYQFIVPAKRYRKWMPSRKSAKSSSHLADKWNESRKRTPTNLDIVAFCVEILGTPENFLHGRTMQRGDVTIELLIEFLSCEAL